MAVTTDISVNGRIRNLISALVEPNTSSGPNSSTCRGAVEDLGSDCSPIKKEELFRFFWKSCLFGSPHRDEWEDEEEFRLAVTSAIEKVHEFNPWNMDLALEPIKAFLKLAGDFVRFENADVLESLISLVREQNIVQAPKSRAGMIDSQDIWRTGKPEKLFGPTNWKDYQEHSVLARLKQKNSGSGNWVWRALADKSSSENIKLNQPRKPVFHATDWSSIPYPRVPRAVSFSIFEEVRATRSKLPAPIPTVVLDKSRLSLDIAPQIPEVFSQSAAATARPRLYIGSLLVSEELANFHIESALENSPRENPLQFKQLDFIDEIVKTACGQQSAIYLVDHTICEFRLIQPVHVIGICFPAVESICTVAVSIGKDVLYIQSTLAELRSLESVPSSDTIRIFVSCLEEYMSSWISQFGLACRKKKCLPAAGCVPDRFWSPLLTVKKICKWAVANLIRPTSPSVYPLLEFLFTLSIDVSASPSVVHLVLHLFQETIQPFIFFANNLAFDGKFADPHNEFGVYFNEDNVKKGCLDYWEESLTIQEISQCFLKDALEDVVRCGKSLILLSYIQPNHPLLKFSNEQHDGSRKLRFSFSDSSSSYLEEFSEKTEALERLLAETENLNSGEKLACSLDQQQARDNHGTWVRQMLAERSGSTLGGFDENWRRSFGFVSVAMNRDLFPLIVSQENLAHSTLVKVIRTKLLSDGHLAAIHEYFFLALGEFATYFVSGIFEKITSAPLKSPLELSFFVRIFELSIADQAPDRSSVASRIMPFCDREAVAIIMKDSISYDITDFLGLLYKVEWPLNLLITPEIIDQANTVFRRLLKLKGAIWAINQAHFLLVTKNNVENPKNLRVLNIYRSEMGQVLRALEAQMMEDAVASSWLDLQRSLSSATSIEELREVISGYVKRVTSECLLKSGAKITKAIGEMCRYALRFCLELRNGSSFSELQKTFLVFQRCTMVLLSSLKNGKADSSEFSVDDLFLRVDYAGYFELQNASKKLRNLLRGTL